MPDGDRPLDPKVKAALDKIAGGAARRATAAHPDCVCGTDGPRACPQHSPRPPSTGREGSP